MYLCIIHHSFDTMNNYVVRIVTQTYMELVK